MGKIGPHLIGTGPSWLGDYLTTSGAGYVKGLGWYPNISGVRTIGRVYMGETAEPEPLNSMIRRGAAGADELFGWVWPEVEKNPHVWAWELYNEPGIGDDSVLAGFVAFNQRLIQLMHDRGRRICVGALSTSWPHAAQMDAVMRACQGADAISFHEYGWADMRSDASVTHYRDFHNYCQSHGYPHPPILITETGLDQCCEGTDHGHWGWRHILSGNEDRYVEMLVWYDAELRRDDYVLGAFVFTTGGGWDEFEFNQSVAMKTARATAGEIEPPEPPPEPPPLPEPVPVSQMARGFYASAYQGEIDYEAAQAAGYSYVLIRTSVGLSADPTFERNWNAAGEAGLLRAPWHYLTPTESGQSAKAASVLGDRVPEIPVFFVDLEADTTMAKADQWFGAFSRNFPNLQPGYYTSAGWANPQGGVAAWDAAGFRLWVANWTNGDAPLLPNGATEWAFWQWSGQMPAGGPFPEPYLPDRFVGSINDLYEWCGLEPPDNGEEPEDVRILDQYGNEQDWAWVQSRYGDVSIAPISGDGFRVIQLTETEGPMVFTCALLNKAGGPEVGRQVAYIWPDGESIEITNTAGVAEHTAGAGEGYDPANGPGPISWQVRGGAASETISGLGWLWGTNHAHLNVIMQYSGGDEPTPPTPDENWEALFARLDTIIGQLDTIDDKLAAGWTVKPV